MKKASKGAMAPAIPSGGFPKLGLPLQPPYPPMEAKRQETIPRGSQWLYEPKWDGFRALVFRDGDEVALQSKAGQPLTRYFPELVAAVRHLKSRAFILDAEIVIPISGRLSFDDLLLRIHPAASRVDRLSREIPGQMFVFDLLYQSDTGSENTLLSKLTLEKRRTALEKFFQSVPQDSAIKLSPATTDEKVAEEWFNKFGALGLDGVMAKRINEPYHSGDREAMVKVKHLKTADCVVGGFRYASGGKSAVGSLLLGLYDDQGRLNFIGHTSSFNAEKKKELKPMLEALRGESAFEVRAPGGPSRWSNERTGEWEAVDPKLVCEVEFDYFSQGRFRHGSKFLRWRPDKPPRSCTMEQVLPPAVSRGGDKLTALTKRG